MIHTRELAVCRTNSADFLRIIPLTDRDHQVQLGVARKMVDIRLTIRSVLVECLQHLLIQSEDHDVWPNVEFMARLRKHPTFEFAFGSEPRPTHGLFARCGSAFESRERMTVRVFTP